MRLHPLLTTGAFLLTATTFGQTPATTTASAPAPTTAAPGVLTQTVEPSFRIEPVVLRFSARRGEVIPFEFAISSLGKQMDVTIEPVNLRQEETGLILHDQHSQPETALKLSTPGKFNLSAGAQQKIVGELTVPLAKTNYLSYGILVREAGKAPDFQAAGEAETKAGIRFVTQYVLRVDVETGVADVGALKQLQLQNGGLVGHQGLPLAQTFLANPTDYAFECHVSATLASASGRKPRPIPLGMASRATLEGPERYLVRIMPKSRLRLEAPIDAPLLAGEQSLHVAVSGDRREAVAADFAIKVAADDFPGLEPQRAIVGGAVAVAPAQLELGTIAGVRRTVGMRFTNTSAEVVQLAIQPQTFSGEPLAGVRLNPPEFQLLPGSTKTIRAALASSAGDGSRYGVARVSVTRPGGAVDFRDLPLAVITAPRGEPDLDVSAVTLDAVDGRPAFVVRVKNRSEAFVPMSALLDVAGPSVGKLTLEAGYGKWLRPGAAEQLLFRPRRELPPGEYQLALQLATHADATLFRSEYVVSLSAPEQAAVAPQVPVTDTAG